MKISTLLFICAISLSAVAAYYSIVGLATLFSAAFVPVVIMAAVLEISKLVCASWLYQKWNEINNLIKVYLTTSVVVLMLITSLGIFGFLTRAHTDQKLNTTEIQLQLNNLSGQKSILIDSINQLQLQLAQLDKSINIQLDSNRATQALAARQRQTAERNQVNTKIADERQKLVDIQEKETELQKKLSVLDSELGPIKYVADFFMTSQSVDYDKAIRYMILVIVLVFDPLAVLMLIAANMSLKKENQPSVQPVPASGNNQSEANITDDVRGTIDIRYDFEYQRLMYFNGSKWNVWPTELPSNAAEIDYDMIKNAVHAAVSSTVANESVTEAQLEAIQETVKNAMNSWLNSQSNNLQEPQNPPVEETPVEANSASPVDTPVVAPPAKPMTENVQPTTSTALQPPVLNNSWL